MSLVEWKDEYSLGNELIDSQHKSLFAILNDLAESGPGNKEDSSFKCLGQMEEYARVHFRDEERLMSNNGYPGLAEQIEQHKVFLRQVEDYKISIFSSYVPYQDIVEYLNNWLVEHILGSDQKFMDYMKKR